MYLYVFTNLSIFVYTGMLPVKLIEGRIASDLKANMAAIRDFVEANEKLKKMKIIKGNENILDISIKKENAKISDMNENVLHSDIVVDSEVIVDSVSNRVENENKIMIQNLKNDENKVLLENEKIEITNDININENDITVKKGRKRDFFSPISRLFIGNGSKKDGKKDQNTENNIKHSDQNIDIKHTENDNENKDINDIKSVSGSSLSGSPVSGSVSGSEPVTGSKTDLSDFSTFTNSNTKNNNNKEIAVANGDKTDDISVLINENKNLKIRIIYLENEMKKINNVLNEIENLVKL